MALIGTTKAGTDRRLAWLISLVLVGVTVLIFWPVTGCDFVNLDDPDYVTANARVQSGLTLRGLEWAFTTGATGNWHPLTWLSLMLDASWFGIKPGGFHFTSLALHTANAVLLFWLLRRLTGATWRSALVAAGFAWHPLAVESVAWVAERKNVLSTCFGLLSLLFYAQYTGLESGATSPSPKAKAASSAGIYYGLSLLMLALGLLSKPMLVTWPFLLLVLDYWPLGRWRPGRWRALAIEKIPFLALAVAASIVTFLAQRHGGTVVAVSKLPFAARLGNAVVSYVRYVEKLVWPVDLAAYYPHPGAWPATTVAWAGAALAVVTWLVWARRRQQPYLLTGWLWYLGTLVPVIGLVQVGGQAMADRYTYVPGIGLLVGVVWLSFALGRRGRAEAVGLAVVGGIALVGCLAATRQQIGYWRNSEVLLRRALAVTENNWLAHYNLGEELDQQGRTDEAMSQYQAAFECRPNYAEAHNNLGVDLERQGKLEAAAEQYKKAIQCKFDYADAWDNLGVVQDKAGQIDEALRDYERAVELSPENPQFHKSLGEMLDKTGRIDEAMQRYQTALKLKPDYAEADNNLGVDFAREGRPAEAEAQFQRALSVQPGYGEAGGNLGYLWTEQGMHLPEALALIRQAWQANPRNASTLDSLGWVLLKLNRPAEGLTYERQAVELSPQPDAAIYDHLGDIYAALNQRAAAAAAWRQSLAISPNSEVRKKLDAVGGR